MPHLKRRKNSSKKRKLKRIRRASASDSNSSGGASRSNDTGSSISKKKRLRDRDPSDVRVAKGKIKNTLTVGRTEVNSLRNTGRNISYAFNVNTSKNARKSDAGVSIKSTLYNQGGDKKLRIQKIDFDNASKFKDTIDSIVSMDQVDGKDDPLKKIEIDLAGVADLGKLNDALKDIDPSVEIEFKFKDKDRNRPYQLEKGYEGVKFFMEASKGRPKKNEAIAAVERLVGEANKLQSKDSPTLDDMDKIQYLNQQIDGFLKQAESEMKGDGEKKFLQGVKLALDLESNRVTQEKSRIEAEGPKRDDQPTTDSPPPRDEATETRAAEDRSNIEKTLSTKKTETNKLRNIGREIGYAFEVNTSRSASKDDAGVTINSTLFKQGNDKKLIISKIDFDDPTKLKNTIDAIVGMDQLGDSKNDPLKKVEIDLGGVSDLGKLKEALKDLNPSIEIELKFKDKDRNRPFVLKDGFAGVKFLMDAFKGKPNRNENLDAIGNLVNEAKNLQSKKDLALDDFEKIQFLNQQIDGFIKRAETEMNTVAEKNFLEGLKLALDLESERVASDKTELEESEAKREEDRQKEQETERKKEEKDQEENEASEDQPKKEKDQDENQQVDKGLVVNLDPGDKTIDKAFKDIEKRDTDLETPVRPVTDTTQKENKKYELFKDFKKDQVDFSEAGKDGPILLLAHGMPRYPWLIPSDSSSTYAFRFANMSPNKFANYLINNNLPKDYSGMIYLDGCYTASGNTKKNFALQVYNRLVDQGYNFLQVKGNLGAAVTLNDGTEIVTHAAVEKQAKKLSKEISKLDKNKADLENKINEILRPSKNEENALKLNIVVLKDKLGKAEESGDQIEIGKLEKEIQKIEEQKKYATQIIENLKQDDEYQKTNDELVSLDDTLSIKRKELSRMEMPALTGSFGPAALPSRNPLIGN